MTPELDLDAWLAKTLEDRRFSRNERQAAAGALAEEVDREHLRRRAFELARGSISNLDDRTVLDWLEELLKSTRDTPATQPKTAISMAHFSPGEDCLAAVRRFVGSARKTLDICVFTITDDRVTDTIVEAHRRGVEIRLITDNEKAEDLGSDINRIAEHGVAVRVDRSSFHMHHKFAVADGSALLTGSYNWTRGAARDNQENLIVTDDPRLIEAFRKAFDRLWSGLE